MWVAWEGTLYTAQVKLQFPVQTSLQSRLMNKMSSLEEGFLIQHIMFLTLVIDEEGDHSWLVES